MNLPPPTHTGKHPVPPPPLLHHHTTPKINATRIVPVRRQFPLKPFILQLSLKNHQFGFGSKLEDSLIVEEPMSDYFKLVKYLFNWATLQSYKWNFDKSENPSVSFWLE